MQKWEYLKISTDTGKVRRINEVEVANWKSGSPYMEYLNVLGSQGWEMIALAMEQPESWRVVFYLKGPI